MAATVPSIAEDFTEVLRHDEERQACEAINPAGFQIRHPPPPYELSDFYTSDEALFQTTHMGAAVVRVDQWKLVINGMVQRPFAVTFQQLKNLPSKSIVATHECFGSPLQPPAKSLLRVGNVKWTGVPLSTLISLSKPSPLATFIWSEGLDSGKFAGITSDRYQKDLPMEKALSGNVLVAYQINGKPLSKERGGPVRLIVPGWFGTNSTKWLCRLSLQDKRAPGPWTTTFYNVRYPGDLPNSQLQPVWEMDVNSMITRPVRGQILRGPVVVIEGWAWSSSSIENVTLTVNGGETWVPTHVKERVDFSWQKFSLQLHLQPASYTVMARATDVLGASQPLAGCRNHANSVKFQVTC